MRKIKFKNCQDAKMYNEGYEDGRKDALSDALKLADCNDTECWDCAFGDALVVCRLKHLLKEKKDE